MRLLVTRPRADAERFVAALAEAGHEAVVAPLLDIAIRNAPDELARALESVQALVFTSANGVRAFAANSPDRALPVFAVGDRTAAAAAEDGFSQVASAEGDVADLAALLRARLNPAGGPLLHVAGSAVAGDLAGDLAAQGFEVRRAVLYEAAPAEALPEAARIALAQGAVFGVTFFSPRTASSFVRLVRAEGLAHAPRRLTAFCLSPAVAEAARDLDWAHVRTAAQPTQAALLAAIRDAATDTESVHLRNAGRTGQGNSVMAETGEPPRDDETADPNREATGDSPGDPNAGPKDGDANGDANGGSNGDANGGSKAAPEGQSVAETVIARFGGLRPTATKVGVAVSTVQGWKARGHIPASRHEELRAAAAQHGIDLSDIDLEAEAAKDSAMPAAQTDLRSGAEPGAPAAGATPGDMAGETPKTSGAPAGTTDLSGVSTAAGPNPWGGAAESGRDDEGEPSAGATKPAVAAVPGAADVGPAGRPAAIDASAKAGGAKTGGAKAGGAEAGGAKEDERSAPVPASAMPPPAPPRGSGGSGNLLMGLFLGIVLVALGAFIAAYSYDYWQPYVSLPPNATQQRVAALETEVETLQEQLRQAQQQLAEQAQGAAAAGTDPQAVESLQSEVQSLQERLGRLAEEMAAMASAGGVATDASALVELRDTVTALQEQVGQLGAQAQTGAGGDPAVVEGLAQHVSDLQDELAALRQQMSQPDAASQQAIADLQSSIGGLTQQLRDVSSRAEEAVRQRAGASGAALALGQLRDALRFADPFEPELQALRGTLPADDALQSDLEVLAGYAGSGVPTRADLEQRFDAMARQAVAASYDESWTGRLLSRVSQAVSVRPVGEVEGDSSRARIARAEARLDDGNLEGAVEALQGLEGEAAAAAAPWIADANARLLAERALTELTRRTLARLSGGQAVQ